MKKITFLVFISLSLLISNSKAQAPTFSWAKQVGAAGADYGFDMVIQGQYIYTTGMFTGTVDFDPGTGTAELVADSTDIFIAKFDTAGNFVWAKKMGGATSQDVGYAIAVDKNGNAYVTGIFKETAEFNPGGTSASLTSAKDFDTFIAKFDASGNFQWVKQIKSTKDVFGYSIAVDDNGDVYSGGLFIGTATFSAGVDIKAPGTSAILFQYPWEGYIIKYNTSGTFQWVKNIGGTSYDFVSSIVLDANKNIYVTGLFNTTASFDPSGSGGDLSSAGGSDIFVAKYDPTGAYMWAKSMGGGGDDWGISIALDGSGNVLTTGVFQATANFNPSGTANITAAGSVSVYDIFVSKLNGSGNYVWAKSMGGDSDDTSLGITTDDADDVYVTGSFTNTADFAPADGSDSFTALGAVDKSDNFISKFKSDGSYAWTQQFGGIEDDGSQTVKVDSDKNIYAIGGFKATTDFNPSATGTFNMTADSTDLFILKLSQISTPAPCAVATPTVTVVDSCETSTLTSSTTTGTYLWSPGGETTQAITVTSGSTHTVTITEGACTSAAGAGTAAPTTTPATPSAVASNACGSSTLSASTSTGTYLWFPGSETTKDITVTTGGSYSVTITENGCTSAAGTVTAAPTTIPSAPGVSDINYCQNSTASALTATGTSLLWYLVPTGGPAGEPTAPTPSTSTIGQTNYYVSQTVSGCESDRDTIAVDITAGTAAPTVANIDYCTDDVATPLTATGTSLLWYLVPTGGPAGDPTAPTPVTTNTATTSYYVSQTQCGEGPRAQLDVTVKATPTAPTVTAVNNCGSADLTASNYTGTLLWSTAETSNTINVTNAATYSVTQTVNGCTSASGTTTAAPTAIPATPTVVVSNACGSSTLSSSTSTGTYHWFPNNETTKDITVTSGGSYSVTITENGCTSNAGTATAAPTAAPAAPTVTSPVNYCQNDVVTALTATGTNLLWYTASTGGGTGILSITPSTTSIGTTNYYVSQTISACESSRTLIAVNISAGSSAAPTVTSPVNYCSGDIATPLTATGTNLLWYTAATNGTGSSTATTPSTTTSASYFVSQNICVESSRSEIIVTVTTAPTVTVNDVTICSDATTGTITASGATVYSWSPASNLSATTGAAVVTSATASTSYIVTGTTAGCSSSATSTVTLDATCITGINENNNSLQEITMYPNPSNGEVNISISNANFANLNVSIINLLGTEVYRRSFNNSTNEFNKQLNLDALVRGIYYVKLNIDTDTKTLKLIIQ